MIFFSCLHVVILQKVQCCPILGYCLLYCAANCVCLCIYTCIKCGICAWTLNCLGSKACCAVACWWWWLWQSCASLFHSCCAVAWWWWWLLRSYAVLFVPVVRWPVGGGCAIAVQVVAAFLFKFVSSLLCGGLLVVVHLLWLALLCVLLYFLAVDVMGSSVHHFAEAVQTSNVCRSSFNLFNSVPVCCTRGMLSCLVHVCLAEWPCCLHALICLWLLQSRWSFACVLAKHTEVGHIQRMSVVPSCASAPYTGFSVVRYQQTRHQD